MKKIILFLAAATITASSARAQSTLINENFEGGASYGTSFSNNGLIWNWNLVSGPVVPNAPETYGSSTASWRDMPSTHGGFEVASDPDPQGSTWSVSVDVTSSIVPSPSLVGNVSFDAGYRYVITSGYFSVFNLSKAIYLLAPQQINNIYTTNTWNSQNYSFDFSSVDLGDTIRLKWVDTPTTGSNGLEVGPVTFSVQSVPEPSTYLLFGIGAIGMLMVRRRKKTA